MILAAFNPKGGTGKTTTAVNVAAVLASMRRKVLLVDLEADLNASISLGVRPAHARRPSIAEVLTREARPADAVRPVGHTPNLFLLTGSPDLAHIDNRLRNVREPERRLADVIKPLVPQFDTIILDSPAGYSLLARSVPLIADQLIVPIRAEYLSLESLAHFLTWYRDYHAEHKTTAQLCGILLTMVDHRRQATTEIIDIIRLHNRRGVLLSEVPQDPRVAESPSHGVPVVAYAPASRGSRAYRRVAAELLTRIARRAR
ncbi:MAG TPA: ParA family protein [Vicinamibacterales bacterium]|nr:ParA family protein [Vicinamibacterales bacterium]